MEDHVINSVARDDEREEHDSETLPILKQPPLKHGGLNVAATIMFLAGEMAGSGVLALPKAVVNSGWIGLVVLVFCAGATAYSGVELGVCWTMLLERHPECNFTVRKPYAEIATRAFNRAFGIVVSICLKITLFMVATVFLLLASQMVHSLLQQAGVHISYCYISMIFTAFLIPCTWCGSPKDFWPIAYGAFAATLCGCVLIVVSYIMHLPHESPPQKEPGFRSVFLSFGALLFAFGGASTFPTIQHDMKEPKKFTKAIIWAYILLLCLYFPVAAGGYFLYGTNVNSNVTLNLVPGPIRITIEILITVHLLFAILIILNPLMQETEDRLGVPHSFGWKRCIVRTILVHLVLFTADSFPHFGAMLDLVGGSTITFLNFVAPPLCYIKLCRQVGPWPTREIKLHHYAMNIIIVLIGIVGGIASTYSAVLELFGPDTFVPPCYVNITAADPI